MKWHCILPIVLTLPLAAQVNVTRGADTVKIEIDGKPFSEFFYQDPAAPKPYLHPLRSASGKIVTRHFPMEKVPGENTDHPHHRGLWFTHGDVNGVDFWMNETADKSKTRRGKIILEKINGLKSGKTSGSVSATFTWQEPEGKRLMREERVMTFYSDPKLRIVDFDIKLTAINETKFGDTKEGAFAIRLATALTEQRGGGKMVNAEGKVGEKLVWGKPSPWVDYCGQLDGEALGVAIFDHPSNPRYPTHWHARAYGLFATNIFGLHDFYSDKTKDGSLTLKPGDTARFRFRVVIHPGDTESAGIAGMYKEWAR
jgi:hypothetical protein